MSRVAHSKGIALINALVIVGAMSAIMVFVTRQTVDSHARVLTMQTGLQSSLYLDAMEPLLPILLEEDWEDDPTRDDLTDVWAREDFTVPIGRGIGQARIHDLQGRFNINWLTDLADTEARAAFDRLITDLGLSPALGTAIAGFVSPEGPANAATYQSRASPIQTPNGPIRVITQLRAVAGMDASDFERLRPYIAALPAPSVLNANTASPEVLEALFPGLNEASVARIAQQQRADPFVGISGFVAALGQATPSATQPGWPLDRVDVKTSWFHAQLSAEVDGTPRQRHIFLNRRNDSGEVSVAFVIEGQL